MGHEKTDALLRQVSRRIQLARFGQRLCVFTLIAAGVYLAALLAARLTGYYGQYLQPWTLAVVPLLGAALALIFHRPASSPEAARRVDQFGGTKDLYLTVTMMRDQTQAAMPYCPLVSGEAERRAEKFDAARIVSFDWLPGARALSTAAAALALAVLFVPQLDPFGQVEKKNQADQRREALNQTRRATDRRLADLKAKPESPESKMVKTTVDQLKQVFNEAKPMEQAANFQKLSDQMKQIDGVRKQISDKKLRDMLNQASLDQQFGTSTTRQQNEWKQQLSEGKADGIKRELSDLKEMAEQLGKEGDPQRREQIKQEMQQRMRQLADFMAQNMDGEKAQALQRAMERAMEQMQASDLKELSEEALKAAAESLELSEMELQNLEDALKNIKDLEEALKACQMAKMLNDKQKLDGAAAAKCKSLAEYAEFYKQMMAEMAGENEGPGQGGPGRGRGNPAEEDESTLTRDKPEEARSPLTAGKILMSWKAKGLAEAGDNAVEVEKAVAAVKQGVAEAIDQEQVPPGYIDPIKKYFDTIEQSAKPDDAEK